MKQQGLTADLEFDPTNPNAHPLNLFQGNMQAAYASNNFAQTFAGYRPGQFQTYGKTTINLTIKAHG